jgi:hypothetical protein
MEKIINIKMPFEKILFHYNNEDFILWTWKEDYIILGAGTDLGIYYGGGLH